MANEFLSQDENQRWDGNDWLTRFHDKSYGHERFRALRKEVFLHTVQTVIAGHYRSINGREVFLEHSELMAAHRRTEFYSDAGEIRCSKPKMESATRFDVIEADCLEVFRLISKAGYNPAVLNMASNSYPGGGVQDGAGAQEENLFRRSTAFSSLYQFVDIAAQYGVDRNQDFSYPIPRKSGGIYSPDVIIFRSSESTGYYLLDHPYTVSMISVAAISRPRLTKTDGKLRIVNDLIEPSKEKIRTILRIAAHHGHDALVLSALGCGAYLNPPEHMTELFAAVFAEAEIQDVFRFVVFAIIDDHNNRKSHNPVGNIIPFQQVFR